MRLLYLATPNTQQVRKAIEDGLLGAMLTPDSWTSTGWTAAQRFGCVGLDNGCFGNPWSPAREKVWLGWLDKMALMGDRVRFAVAPDVFDPSNLGGNHQGTLELWHRHAHEITDRGLPAAFVAQNGCTPDDVPAEADAVFIGGDTTYKLSEMAWAVIAASNARSKWTHVGRVNTLKRLRACAVSGALSVDGTLLRWPDANLPILLRFLDEVSVPRLSLLAPGG